MARILIVGAGVVGQATGKGFARKGHDASYVDVNPTTITKLRAEGLRAIPMVEVDWDAIDVVMLAVSTPTAPDGSIVLDHILAAACQVGRGLATTDKYITVVVRSTVLPTTTEQRITPLLEAESGKRAGKEFGLAMNPEFLRQAHSEQDFARPWITVIGSADDTTRHVLNQLYAQFGALIVHCTPTEAEMIKYVNNIYNAVKISYFNEVHDICQQLNIDGNLVGAAVARSAESMWNPIYGTHGGVPYGGACLPKDTAAFMSFVYQHGWDHRMLKAAIEVNQHLQERIPPATSPDEIDTILEAFEHHEGTSGEPLMIELGMTRRRVTG
jgi:UDPglucose 6-dehydrogenase